MSTSFSTLKIVLVLVSVLALTFSAWGAQPVQAAGTFTFTDCTDPNITTDIQTALNGGGIVNVIFRCNAPATSPIVLSSTLTTLTSGTVVIKADPGYNVALSGGGSKRVLKLAGGIVNVTLDNLTIMNGHSYADISISDSGYGGGVLVSGGTLNVNNVTFTGNIAQGGRGGAIYNFDTLNINNSTFESNIAPGAGSYSGGGAVYNYKSLTSSGLAYITNSTFYNNTAGSTGTNPGGGAIYNNSGSVAITNSTFYANVANSHVGGGVFNYSGTVALTNSIVAKISTSIDENCSGTITLTNNVSGNDATCAAASSTLTEIFGVAAPILADNGGKTKTFAIPNSGPAYNLSNGGTPVTDCPANDQRGMLRNRTAEDACDAGAFEYHPASTTMLSTSPASPTYGETITLTATVTPDVTGSVEFYDAATDTLLGTATVSSGQASYPLGVLNAGSYSYKAVYTGDSVYDPSKSNLSLTVNPKTLTVTAQNKTRVVGAANPALTYAITGFVNGDSETDPLVITGAPVLSTTADIDSVVDDYPITITKGTLQASSNYTLNFTNGVLSVVPAPRFFTYLPFVVSK